MKKALIIHQSYSYSGTDVFALNLIEGLKEHDYESELLINSDKIDLEVFENIKKHFYKTSFLTFYSSIKLLKLLKKIIFVLSYPILVIIHTISVYKQIKKIKPNIIILVNAGIPGGFLVYIAAIACALSKIKTIYTIHNACAYPKIINIYNYLIEKFMTKFSNIIFVTVSNYNAKNISKNSFFIKNLKVIHNGVENLNFENSQNLNKSEYFKIVFVGNLLKIKGIEILIDAFRRLNRKDCILYIYSTPHDTEYVKLIQKLIDGCNEIKLIFNEFDKNKIYADKDLFILPSIDHESFGQVLIEAMTFNIPILGSNGLGIKEVIEIDGELFAGELFNLGDSSDLLMHINKLLNNKELYLDYQNNCSILYEKYFTSKIMIKNYIKIIEGK